MSWLYESWTTGVGYLISDDLISYFIFTTTAIAEALFFWAFGYETALAFTLILYGCVMNVYVNSFWGGYVAGCNEKLRIVTYWLVYLILFVLGCFVNFAITVAVFAILFGVTGLWINLHQFQICAFGAGFPKFIYKIANLFENQIFYILSVVFIIGIPIAVVIVFLALTDLSVGLKIMLSVLYIAICPLIAYYEDTAATMSIFELGYEDW